MTDKEFHKLIAKIEVDKLNIDDVACYLGRNHLNMTTEQCMKIREKLN